MTALLEAPREPLDAATPSGRAGPLRAQVLWRRTAGVVGVCAVVAWAWLRAVRGDGPSVNGSAGALLRDLGSRALRPELGADFLRVVADALLTTLCFAALGTAGALLVGIVGGLLLSDVGRSQRVPAPWRALRGLLRAGFVAVRSVHELVWALLLVTVLGLDPLVAVLALVLPFGAQTAQVFAETLDSSDTRAYLELRRSGAPGTAAFLYALLPPASPLLLSYSFYRFECSVRSTVLLGFVGVGGLGQQLAVSLQSRNWEEVWTLVYTLMVLSACVEVWSSRVRRDVLSPGVVPRPDQRPAQRPDQRPDQRADAEGAAVAVMARTNDGHAGPTGPTRRTRRLWSRATVVAAIPVLLLSWWAADLTPAGLVDPVTWQLTEELVAALLPPAMPDGGPGALATAVMDTLAMAVLATALAVGTTLTAGALAAGRTPLRHAARLVLLGLRSVPPTVWAVLSLFLLLPGILPGALALGLYAGGILGRLVAEAWQAQDRSAAEALERAGTPRWLAGVAAVLPMSVRQLVTYSLYRFEVSVRDTTVVGIVGAAGLGRLLAEALASFRFPTVAALLLTSFLLSAAAELAGRRLRRALAS